MDGLPLDHLCFFDTETRALPGLENSAWGDITKTSSTRYANSQKVIIFTYAIGDGPLNEWVLEDFDGVLDWRQAPQDLKEFRWRVLTQPREYYWVAFNSGFDRKAVNRGTRGPCPREVMAVEEVLDAAALAAASNLPGNLEEFSKATGGVGKLPDGKWLIDIFCPANGRTPAEMPTEWRLFRDYAKQDVAALRDAYKAVLPQGREFWREFWASEYINDRGLPLDMDYVRAAARLADEYLAGVNERVDEISGGKLRTIKQHAAIADWVFDRVGAIDGAQAAMAKTFSEEDGEEVPDKIGLDRQRVKRLIAMLRTTNEEIGLTDEEAAALDLLELREYGASATPGKFAKMIDHEFKGRLPNQYLFSGAQQTGRFSSRGVQMHNLTRDAMKNEEEVIAAILEGVPMEEVKRLSGDVGKALAWTVRPAIAAPKGRTLVWGDWSNIEARKLPWLAGDDPGAQQVLEVFRNVDRDPVNNPDVYCLEAAKIEGRSLQELWDEYRNKAPWAKAARQKGKIAVLSLGFGGGVGALLNMAANYGMSFPEDEAAVIVDAWRAGNPWARGFWMDLWGAALAAIANPGEVLTAGRIKVLASDSYIGDRTLFLILPDGRALVYPDIRWGRKKFVDPKTGEEEYRDALLFQGQYGPKAVWYGTFAENVTQASAASLLRATLTDLEMDLWPHEPHKLVGHTHDEAIAETDDRDAAIADAREILHRTMTKDRSWTAGLPLAAEIDVNWYYTKAELHA